jgi:hypothetical protein
MYPLQSAATARMHPPTMSKSRGRCCELEACGTPPSINSENKHFMNRNAGKNMHQQRSFFYPNRPLVVSHRPMQALHLRHPQLGPQGA